MDNDARLLIFARAPRPGQCKTRLGGLLGETGAAEFHAALVQRSVRTFSAQPRCRPELWCAPDTSHALFRQLRQQYAIPLYRQPAGDLGVRMATAARQRLQQYTKVILMGTDCPLLEPHHLGAVLEDLDNGYDASIIPAEDGGYVMLGLRRFDAGLFTAMDWGTDRVMTQTAARLARIGWRWRRHQALWDIDRTEDYVRFTELRLEL